VCIAYDKIVFSFLLLVLFFFSLVKKKIFLNQYSYTHTHIKTAYDKIVMPEFDPHNPKHRYAEIQKIIVEIKRIHPKIFNLEFEDGRKNAESYIRMWYAKNSLCGIVTQRDRIQTAWTHYDYEIIKKQIILSASVKPVEYENPEEFV
jgi:hypothetical protein